MKGRILDALLDVAIGVCCALAILYVVALAMTAV